MLLLDVYKRQELRISKTPANAHEIKYFSELAVGCCDVWIGYVGGFYGLG